MGLLAYSCKWALPEALSLRRGGLCLLSRHPVADLARLGVERGQLPGPKPRRAEVIAGCWTGWELGGAASRGVGSDRDRSYGFFLLLPSCRAQWELPQWPAL